MNVPITAKKSHIDLLRSSATHMLQAKVLLLRAAREMGDQRDQIKALADLLHQEIVAVDAQIHSSDPDRREGVLNSSNSNQ